MIFLGLYYLCLGVGHVKTIKNEDRDIFVNISYIYRIHKTISNEIQRVAVGVILLLKFSRQNDTIITFHAQLEHNTSNHNSLS